MISKNEILLKLAEYISTDAFLGDSSSWVSEVKIVENAVSFLVVNDSKYCWHRINIS